MGAEQSTLDVDDFNFANNEGELNEELICLALAAVAKGMEMLVDTKHEDAALTRILLDIERDVGRFLIETKWLIEIANDDTLASTEMNHKIKNHEKYQRFLPLFCELYSNVLAWIDQLTGICKKLAIKASVCSVMIVLCGVGILASVLLPATGWVVNASIITVLAAAGTVSLGSLGVFGLKLKESMELLNKAKALIGHLEKVRKAQEKVILGDDEKKEFQKLKKMRGADRYKTFLKKFETVDFVVEDLQGLYKSLDGLYQFCDKAL